jgi:fatty-acyl-CoA synthase
MFPLTPAWSSLIQKVERGAEGEDEKTGHTGDLAVEHPDGYVEIKDRAKDIIVSGGENISSVEVEIALYKHPAGQLAAVVARPDEKWGETPCAFVQLKPGATATAEELIAFCRERLARFKLPKTVVFGALPTTATGKIQKFVLREEAKGLSQKQIEDRKVA